MPGESGTRMLVFQLGGERFALSIAAVDEVVDTPPFQRLPDVSPSVLGIAALRGELVSIFDARRLLHVGDGAHAATLLFSAGNRRVGIAVDDVFDPMLIQEGDLRPAPGMDAADGMLQGVVRDGTNLVSVLDADALVRALLTSEGEKG